GGNSQGEPTASRNLLYSEVDRDQLLGMILQECAPGLRRRPAGAHHVLAHAALADVEAEFEQLSVDAGCTPTGILPAHLADQISDLAGNERSSAFAPSHLPGPEQAKAGAMPGHDGFGFDDRQRRAPAAPSKAVIPPVATDGIPASFSLRTSSSISAVRSVCACRVSSTRSWIASG